MSKKRKAGPTSSGAPVDVVSFGEQRESYRAELEAATPGNRFMRRRNSKFSQVERSLTPLALWNVCQTSRHMVQNDSLPGQCLKRLADNVIQNGFRLAMDTGDLNLNSDIEAMYTEWSNNPKMCDFYGESNVGDLTWMSFLQTAQDGEVYFLFLDDGRMQIVECDRCVGPDPFQGGVIVDGDARVTGYRFAKNIPLAPFASDKQAEVYDVFDKNGNRQVSHLYCPDRNSQHRGYAWLHPVMIKAGMLDDLEFCIVVKAQSASTISAVAERTDKTAGPIAKALGYQNTNGSGPNGVETHTELRASSIVDLPYGRKLAGFSPVVPNSEHFMHVEHIIREIGAALNMPLEMVLLDSSLSNFSGYRGAMDNARMSYRRLQRTWDSKLLTPMMRWKLQAWLPRLGMVARAKALTGNLFKHKWIAPSWRYIQPVEEAHGAAIELENNTASPSEIVARQGKSYDEVVRETVRDNGDMVMAALKKVEEIKKQFPDAQVDWREIARMRLPHGYTQTGTIEGMDPNADPVQAPAPQKTAVKQKVKV